MNATVDPVDDVVALARNFLRSVAGLPDPDPAAAALRGLCTTVVDYAEGRRPAMTPGAFASAVEALVVMYGEVLGSVLELVSQAIEDVAQRQRLEQLQEAERWRLYRAFGDGNPRSLPVKRS